MRFPSAGILLVLFLGACASLPREAPPLGVRRLRCEYRKNPLGLDVRRPRLSWALEGKGRGRAQRAYRILVASSPALLAKDEGDLWDSGEVRSNRNVNIPYSGRPISPGRRYWWKVRARDESGLLSAWSAPAWWETGLMDRAGKTLAWIGDGKPGPGKEEDFYKDDPAPLFRKEFVLPASPVRARLYITGLGYYEARLNGRKVGRRVLDPAWTSYDKRVFYSAYDVTTLLRKGKNCLGAILGNGWFNPLPMRMWGWLNLRDHLVTGRPRLAARLEVECEGGKRVSIGTDRTWKTAPGPILKNNVYLGEVYDARRERPGWDRPGFDDSGWSPAVSAAGPGGRLQAQPQPPILPRGEVDPVSVTEVRPGVFLFDMGVNFAGWVRLRVKGPAGTRVRLRYGELLHPGGTLNVLTSTCGQIKPNRKGPWKKYVPRPACQADTYILKGEGLETYVPRFTFHGFRYVEVAGYPGRPDPGALRGIRLSAGVEEAGSFSCSNELFNRIHRMCRNTFLNNLFGVQSDCPTRERFGWGGDPVPSSGAFIFNFDMAAFYEKVVRDFADAARPSGGLTDTAPYVGIDLGGLGGGTGSIGWQFTHPWLQYQLYRFYGDRRILSGQFETTRRLVDFLWTRSKGGVIEKGISDHESLDPKPAALTGTAFHFAFNSLLSRFARILGREDAAGRYAARAKEIRETFIGRFLSPGTGVFGKGTQASQAFPLFFGLVPGAERKAAVEAMVRAVLEDHEGHLATGMFGTYMLLHELSRAGRADVAYTIVDQRTFPGWGYMLERGATALWEHWAFSDDTFSHDHPMFGSVDAWFYQWLAGIRPAPGAEGLDRLILKPQPAGGLRWVKAHYDGIRGRVVSEWRLEGGRFLWRLVLPPGTRAKVYVPWKGQGEVLEGGRPARVSRGVRYLGKEEGAGLFEVGSGEYRFSSPFTPK